MKTISKLFMAVVAGVLAFSCVTDTTEDLGVNLGEGQSTTLTLSLGESRTYIGEYDGVQYPMYWSVGDKITVNGHTSLALTAEDINGNKATFTIPAILEGDYCVTYPAAPAGQVKFVAEQTHKDNTTFGDGVATLYGYGSPEEIELKNLTGILKIGITGSATLKYAQISTVDRKPIAGAFNLDFAKGVVTPTATAKSVINYSFGDGVALKGDATYIHVAVPAGIYDELYVTLYDTDGGVMYATVKAGDTKPLKAGKVREFKKDGVEQFIEYVPLANDVTVIKNYDDLVKFNKAAASATKVVLANDITILDGTNDTAWTSIADFAGEFYGNGYAIKGLTAPLFGTTYASVIKGVHLEGVKIDGNLTDYCTGSSYNCFGALACVLGNTAIIIENNSVSGNITLDLTGHTKAARIAGVIGAAQTNATSSQSKLVNRANITISGTTDVNKSTELDVVACGVIARCSTACSISDCQNLGSITSTASITNGTHYIGGVGGALFKDMSNCTNGSSENPSLGAVKFNGTSVSTVHVYGLGVTLTNATNCNNYASIELAGTLKGTSSPQYGATGLFPTLKNVTGNVENCNNYGPITVSADISDATAGVVYLSGIGNQAGPNTDSIVNCTNEGTLTFNSEKPISRIALIGGIVQVGDSTCRRENLTNKGDINISASTTGDIIVGGVLGRIRSNGLYGTITNEGKITISGSYGNLYVGGLYGRADSANAVFTEGTFVNKKRLGEENEPSIVFSGTVSGAAHIGGIIGENIEPDSPISATNTGDIECTGTFTDISKVFVGGIYGSTTQNIANANCFCTITAIGYTNVGMITGSARVAGTVVASNCTVGGKITTSTTGEGEAERPNEIELSAGNYFNYIYGSADWTGVEGYDGCKYISAIDAEPAN